MAIHGRGRYLLAVVSALAIVMTWSLFLKFERSEASSVLAKPSRPPAQHPIQLLIERSRASYTETIRNQSTTVDEALREYRSRYKIEPPPGFDKWFAFAKEKKSVIIDEYDTIFESVAPYLAIDGKRLAELVEEALQNTIRLYKCGFKDGKAMGHCGKWDMNIYMEPIAHLMPDVELLFSDYDEPRVIMSPDLDTRQTEAHFDHYGHQDNTDMLYANCGWSRPHPESTYNYGLPFVQDVHESKDLCLHPEYASLHGFIMSPSTLLATHQAVPIVAQCKPSVFNDILYPIPYYALDYDKPEVYNSTDDPAWEDKHNDLYWAGSNNGGYFADAKWKHSHRHRYVAQAYNLFKETSQLLTEPLPGKWARYESSTPLKALHKVYLTDVWPHLCSREQCAAQKDFFPMASQQDSNEQFRHRILMDLDGNSYSGRFYAHLRSKSLSVKQTLFQEWHDDRLWPWVHYVPISMGLEEVPEVVRWFSASGQGARYAKEIAEAGSEWWSKALRKEDMQVYMYRLILEYRRLMDPTRKGNQLVVR